MSSESGCMGCLLVLIVIGIIIVDFFKFVMKIVLWTVVLYVIVAGIYYGFKTGFFVRTVHRIKEAIRSIFKR